MIKIALDTNILIYCHDKTNEKKAQNKSVAQNILITLENSVFETIFIVNHVLKVPIVPKVPFITKTEF
jgi:predicted nucleic acid-binding protein